MKGVFVTGTDTDVGKTWVGKHLIQALLRHKLDVVPRKPVESGWADDVQQTDTWNLANAAKMLNKLEEICPNRFNAPVSPDQAAHLQGVTLSIFELKQLCLNNVDQKQFLFVEGAGGFYSPICSNGLNADLAVALGLPVLLVVDNRLGCINHTLLTIEAIKKNNLNLVALVLNNTNSSCDNNEMSNLEALKKHSNKPIFTLDHEQDSISDCDKLCSLLI